MLVTLSGMATLARLVQPPKAATPKLESWLGIVRFFKLAQPKNVSASILVIPVPIVTLVRLVQSRNAAPPRLVTLLGMETVFRLPHK